MNRILFEQNELLPDGTVRLADARATHIRNVLGATVGRVLHVGMVNGLAGDGRVLEVGPDTVRLAVTLHVETPVPWVDLILAVPRPKVLKRLWAQLAALGVGQIVLINAARVEREYFATHWIQEAHFRPLLIEGLTQAGTTQLPTVAVERRFRPYVEDRLDAEFPGTMRLVAHPHGAGCELGHPACVGQAQDCDCGRDARAPRVVLAVGPEGGWTPFEIELLEQQGFARFSLGSRTLRTDTACVALLSVLGPYLEGMSWIVALS